MTTKFYRAEMARVLFFPEFMQDQAMATCRNHEEHERDCPGCIASHEMARKTDERDDFRFNCDGTDTEVQS